MLVSASAQARAGRLAAGDQGGRTRRRLYRGRFDALLIPGGQSPDQIRTDREVQRFVRGIDAAKKPLFAVGHGAQVLISAQVARGRTMTGSPSIGDDIRNAGGLYRDQPVVQDGHSVASRAAAPTSTSSTARSSSGSRRRSPWPRPDASVDRIVAREGLTERA